jgi:crotonobetainyl-CoA:carnitine CoA-transferase CaiB-like acyl-CoA transferase
VNQERLDALLRAARLALPLGGELQITGRDPVLASRFAIGEVAAVASGLTGVAAARLFEQRTRRSQAIAVDTRAAASSLLGFMLQRSNAEVDLLRHASPTIGLFECGDGRWLHLHGGFPHLAEGALELLGCAHERDAIAAALRGRSALEWEHALAERGLCGAGVRTEQEWATHEQGRALADLPAVEVTKIGDAPPEPLPAADRPLSGVRALDLTRVLAGPTCGRTLAEHGAEVLRIGAERLPSIEPFVIDTGRGKRNAFLDLERTEDAAQLRSLIRGADVFCQGYRSGTLARRGFGAEALAELRPGIVYVSINCYGHVGPLANRAGWEQLAQSITGIAASEGGDGPPRLLPAAATDYTTGFLAAYGVMTALGRRHTEGGSWHVRASLCQTAMWLTRLGGTLAPDASTGLGDVQSRLIECETTWGRLTHLAPVVQMELTPARWERPPSPLGSDEPKWLVY